MTPQCPPAEPGYKFYGIAYSGEDCWCVYERISDGSLQLKPCE